MSAIQITSDIIGWMYFFFWAISFYGQIYENWKCKSVEGLSFEFIGLNLTGFLFYSIYSSVYFFDKSLEIDTTIQDVLFGYNAVFATLITIGQCFVYPRGKNNLKMWCVYLIIALWSYIILYYLITEVFHAFKVNNRTNVWSMMGYEKLLISFVKYIPQVYWNYIRKSTVGWSIMNILCDFAGGLLSFLQIVLDDIEKGQTNIFSGNLNIVKFILSLIAMGFDIIFMVQHYILYPQKKGLLLGNSFSIQKLNAKPVQVTPVEQNLNPNNEQVFTNQTVKSNQNYIPLE